MISDIRNWIEREPVTAAALAVALVGALTIAGALIFQHVVGLAPCPLCLEQRWPYYWAIPLALMVALGAQYGSNGRALVAGLAVVAALMLWGAGLGVYHAGVEWKWWAGPQDCAGGAGFTPGRAGSLLQQMQTARVVRCDEAAWRFLGLSLAGYNVLIALALAGIAAVGAARGWAAARAYGSNSESQ
jgi:disulfide bond formation protein DsbB